MTVRQMIARFHNRLDSGAKVFWGDARAIGLINEILDDICQELVITVPHHLTLLSVQGQRKYQVPSTFMSNELLQYDNGNPYEIVLKNTPRFIEGQFIDVDTQGNPTRGYIWYESGRRELTIYPTFAISNLTIDWYFWGWPEDVSADSDEPSIPIEWHPSIVKEMRNRQRSDDQEISVADQAALWELEIRKIKKMDTFKEIQTSSGRYGTFDGNFPKIQSGAGQLLDDISIVSDNPEVRW